MKRILVVEDEDVIRDFEVINLKRSGYEVVDVPSGEEAMLVFDRNPYYFDVALLDVMMPGIDGFEVCRRVRATNSRIGIIMLTARTQEMDKVSGLMTGADDYVTKPFVLRELLALLLFLLLAWVILRFFQKSIASASQSVLFLLAVPVFFITLVEQLVLHQIYGDTIVLDGQGIVSPVIDHPEMLLLQLFACACLLLSLTAFQKLSAALLARQTICLLEQQAREQEIYIHEAMLRDQKTRAFPP